MKTKYLELDQSPIRPTLGLSEGCDQLEGRGSAEPPPRLRPPVVLLLLSDIEIERCMRTRLLGDALASRLLILSLKYHYIIIYNVRTSAVLWTPARRELDYTMPDYALP